MRDTSPPIAASSVIWSRGQRAVTLSVDVAAHIAEPLPDRIGAHVRPHRGGRVPAPNLVIVDGMQYLQLVPHPANAAHISVRPPTGPLDANVVAVRPAIVMIIVVMVIILCERAGGRRRKKRAGSAQRR